MTNPTGGATLGTLSTATLTIIEDSYDTWLYIDLRRKCEQSRLLGPLATPAGDGITNLVKYAMNINPAIATQGQMPVNTMVNGHAQIAFQWNYNVSDVKYIIEGCSTLGGAWTSLATYTSAGGWVANLAGVTFSQGSVSGNVPYQYILIAPWSIRPRSALGRTAFSGSA